MPKNFETLPLGWRQNIAAANTLHGHFTGGKKSPTYQSWSSMHYRCASSKPVHYKKYGARGITVCERWSSFANFLADMGERPTGTTLDRIDNDGNYELGNCRWATLVEQRRNRRDSKLTLEDVAWVRANAGKITQANMASRLGVSPSAIANIVARRAYK